LHVQEFVNWTGPAVDASGGPQPWKDYLKVRYRLDVLSEPRALVVANALTDSLKRAPNTMAQHFKQMASFSVGELVKRFDCQRVPAALLDYAKFLQKFKTTSDVEILAGLESETEVLKLPQTVHVASCQAFNSDMRQVCEQDKCVVGHAFEDGIYNDAQEVIWLVAEIETKLDVAADLAEVWYDRLDSMAQVLGFRRYHIWLISNEGFADEASSFLQRRGAFSSNKQQLRLLAGKLNSVRFRTLEPTDDADEFLMVVPMGEDNELIAASTVEHIARKLMFQPAAINQIKTAIVEACINASEHSFSPERKIYQRFRVESDKLVITISSRGIVPTNISSVPPYTSRSEIDDAAEERRGWGLKLIRTLMDEVEFERVDEGTSLRMTKYLRNSST
jgi:serine/threonine-protein kinase RsbW